MVGSADGDLNVSINMMRKEEVTCVGVLQLMEMEILKSVQSFCN